MALSRITKIELREQWKHEASDFTNWLAEEENLQLLSDEIGIGITLIQTEASVGRFNVDILAKEENKDRKIVIENQLEYTDHDHLGKIITYASGFDAEIIIWIVKDVRDEHKQAIDWLNEHTDDKINIFAIKMELWQIAGSPYAPNFKIISKPNDWAKAVRTSGQSSLSDTQLMQLDFWTQFHEYSQDNNATLRFRKPYAQHWDDISIGIAKAHLTLIMDTRNSQLRCEIYIPDSKELYNQLLSIKDKITDQLEYPLEWMELEGKKASRIKTVNDFEVSDKSKWKDCFEWLFKSAHDFQSVFVPELKKLGY